MRRGNSQKMAINWLMQKINESTLRFLIVRRSGIIALMQTSSSVDDMEDWSGGVWCRLLTSHQTDEKWKTENAETAQCDFLLVAQTVASLITVQHATFLTLLSRQDVLCKTLLYPDFFRNTLEGTNLPHLLHSRTGVIVTNWRYILTIILLAKKCRLHRSDVRCSDALNLTDLLSPDARWFARSSGGLS